MRVAGNLHVTSKAKLTLEITSFQVYLIRDRFHVAQHEDNLLF